MERDRIRLAQFGVGRWGSHLLRNFLALPEIAVVAVVEPETGQHPLIRRRFGLQQEVQLTDNSEAVLARPDIDAVAIATPAATHYALVKISLTNAKHVLVEKPLTLHVSECQELCRLASQHQRQLVVDHTYLFHPAVQQGRATLASELLGQPRYGYAARTNLGPVRSDVDALWDLSIHDIAIFNYWLNQAPSRVAAQGQTWLQPECVEADQGSWDLADAVWLRLWYPSGFQATIHVCWANSDKQRRLCVVGDRGTLVFDEMQAQSPLVLQRGQFECDGPNFLPVGLAREEIPVPAGEPLQQVCQHFVDCIMSDRPSSLSSGIVGTELVKILAALSKSLKEGGRPITV